MARTEFIRVRVTPEEKQKIIKNALSSYRTPSDYVRDCVSDKEIIVMDGLRELHTELRRQGVNFNQLTVMARQGRLQLIDYAFPGHIFLLFIGHPKAQKAEDMFKKHGRVKQRIWLAGKGCRPVLHGNRGLGLL